MDRAQDRAASGANPAAWLVVAGLLVVTFLIYLPALHGDFLWDDDDYVSENRLLRDADGLLRIWTSGATPQYYPLVFTTFWVEYQLWGQETTGYHAVNILLHAINALLAGCVLRALRVPGAWWVALFFAVHPVHVESVAWITERKNVLSAMFYLSAFLEYLRFERTGRRRDYGAAIALFFAALLSKTVTVTLPVVLLLAMLHQRRRVTRSDLGRLLPFFGLAIVMGLVTVAMEEGMIDVVRDEFAFTPLERLQIATRAPLFYAAKLVVPHPLIFNYPRWSLETATLWAWWPLALTLAIVSVIVRSWRRGRRGPGLLGLYFLITLFPALGLFNVYPFRYAFVADHFQYLASLGFLVLLVEGGRRLVARASGIRRPLGAIVGATLATVLGLLAWNQAGAYRDLETLWRDTLAKHPSSWIANNNLGLILLGRGELDDALERFDLAVRARPDSVESHTARGMARARLGRFDSALEDLDRAVELDPTYPQAYMHRAEVCLALERFDCVMADLGRVLTANPNYLDGYRARAAALLRTGRGAEAIADLDEAIRRGAGGEAHNDRGAAWLQAGRPDLALADFDRALETSLRPESVLHNRGVALIRLGRPAEARADFDRVLELDPAALKTWLVRGTLSWNVLEDRPAACRDWERACRLGNCGPFESHCTVN